MPCAPEAPRLSCCAASHAWLAACARGLRGLPLNLWRALPGRCRQDAFPTLDGPVCLASPVCAPYKLHTVCGVLVTLLCM